METFENVLQMAGYPLPPSILHDGQIHRFGEKNSLWYAAHDDYAIAGDWRGRLDRVTWHAERGATINPSMQRSFAQMAEADGRKYRAERACQHHDAAKEAQKRFEESALVGASAYLDRKRVQAYGLRFADNRLLIPLRDVAGTLWSLQTIFSDGKKQFLAGGRKHGCFHLIGSFSDSTPVYICEGYATAASIHEATGASVVICFDAGNIEPVLSELGKIYSVERWHIAADNDAFGDTNVGKLKAEQAASKHGCKLVLPQFDDVTSRPTDFNDLAQLKGLGEVRRQLIEAGQATVLTAVTLHDFLRMEILPREMILDPIIPEQGLAMLYAMRGIGKTYISLSIALAVASGGTLLGEKWSAPRPAKVLFVDGEMPASVLKERLASLALGMGRELPSPEFFRIITPDMQEMGIPDLTTDEGKQAIEQHMDGVRLLILDNLSSLLKRGKENEAESWMLVQGWLLQLRKRGVSVLLVHHANKTGGQRGTSKKEDVLDTVVVLKRPEDYDPRMGATFSVHYEKARGFFGEAAAPFAATLLEEDGVLGWQVEELQETVLQQAQAMQKNGVPQREIGKRLGISASTINRMLNKEAGNASNPT